MKLPVRTGLATAVAVPALATIAAFAAPASAATRQATHPSGASGVVFVQTDNTSGNQVAVYDRAANGTLKLAATYNTGGLGGQLTGSVADHLASQGALVYDAAHGLLYAVNAGSDTVSVFAASGDKLRLRQTIGSGGTFPVSIAVRGRLVYVVNALDGGSVQGFRVGGGHLVAIPRSNRDLHLSTTATPQFTNTPGQVAFSRNGGQLLVTTKANGNNIDVFKVASDGTLSASPVVNNEPDAVPFAIAYDSSGNLVIAEAGPNALATFDLHANGKLTPLAQVGTGKSATCWVTPDNNHLFASDTGSASVSGYSNAPHGQLALLGNTSTDPGPVDSAASPHGRYLYVQTGANGIVDEFSVTNGALTEIGSVTVANSAGGEGIAAA